MLKGGGGHDVLVGGGGRDRVIGSGEDKHGDGRDRDEEEYFDDDSADALLTGPVGRNAQGPLIRWDSWYKPTGQNAKASLVRWDWLG